MKLLLLSCFSGLFAKFILELIYFWESTVVTIYPWLLQDICFSLNKVKYWILLSWHGNLNPEYSEESIVLYMCVRIRMSVFFYFPCAFLFFHPRQKIDFAQSLNKIWTSQSNFRMRTFEYSNSRRVKKKYRSWKTWRYVLYWEEIKNTLKFFVHSNYLSDTSFFQ